MVDHLDQSFSVISVWDVRFISTVHISMATFMQTQQLCSRTTEMFQQIIGRYEQAESVISLSSSFIWLLLQV